MDRNRNPGGRASERQGRDRVTPGQLYSPVFRLPSQEETLLAEKKLFRLFSLHLAHH